MSRFRFNSAMSRFGALSVLCLAACTSNQAGLQENDAGRQENDAGAGDTTPLGEGSIVGRIVNFAAVSGNDGIEIASLTDVSTTGTSDLRLRFRRFDAQNNAIDDGIEIGRATSSARTAFGLTMATDGTLRRICWSPNERVVCFEIGPAAGNAKEIFNDVGVLPTLTYRAGGAWVLAVRPTAPNAVAAPEISLRRLDAITGSAVGEPVSFPFGEVYFGLPTLFVATPSGYALVAGATAFLYRLDANLAVVGSPLDLGMGYWAYGALAATDTRATIGLSLPYGTTILRVDGNAVVSRTGGGGGGKTGFPVALIAHGTTFSAAWADTTAAPPGTQLRYFDDIDSNAFSAEFSTGPSTAFLLMRLLETKNGIVALTVGSSTSGGAIVYVQSL